MTAGGPVVPGLLARLVLRQVVVGQTAQLLQLVSHFEYVVHDVGRWLRTLSHPGLSQDIQGSPHLTSVEQLEGRVAGGRLRDFSVSKEKIGQPLVPIISRVAHILPQHCLERLVEVLNHSVSLRVVGRSSNAPDP